MRKLSNKPTEFNGRMSKLSWYLRINGNNAVLESVPHHVPMPPAIKQGVETMPGFMEWIPIEGNEPSDKDIEYVKQFFATNPKKKPKFQVEIYD